MESANLNTVKTYDLITIIIQTIADHSMKMIDGSLP